MHERPNHLSQQMIGPLRRRIARLSETNPSSTLARGVSRPRSRLSYPRPEPLSMRGLLSYCVAPRWRLLHSGPPSRPRAMRCCWGLFFLEESGRPQRQREPETGLAP